MLLQVLARIRCSVPALRLVDDGSDDFILNHCVHVDVVVHAAENTVLVRIAYIEVVKKLKPERFELICVVLEQVEVVTDGRQNLVKASLQVTSILFHFQRLLACSSALVLVLHQRLDLLGEHLDLLVDQVVFFGIFLQLVAHRTHDAIDFVFKQVLKLADADVVARLAAIVRSISSQASTPSLVLQDCHNVGVVFTVFFRPLSIVKVDEHISEALVQSVVNSGVSLLTARLLLWLGLLLLTVGMFSLLLSMLLLRVRVLLGSSLPVVLRLLLRLLWLLLSLMLLLVLLEALSMTRLALVTIGARLTILVVRIGCGLLSPGLVLVLNLRADVLIMLVAIESLFFRVLVIFLITLVLALFIVSFARFSGDWLRLASASRRPRARSWVLRLRAVMILVMRFLLLLLVDHIVHGHYF